MSGPVQDSTNLPEPSGPTDDRFVYSLTPAGRQILARHEAATGEQLHQPAARTEEITEAVDRETARRRRAEAKRNGRRFGTVSYRMNGEKLRPLLRLSGDWLDESGFAVGRQFEVTANDRQLVIDVV
jgi:DNA-binding PadR family transcriptional regulator